MDVLQEQVVALNAKVDALYQMIEQLVSKLGDVAPEMIVNSAGATHHLRVADGNYRRLSGQSELDSVMEHKDVLLDTSSIDTSYQGGERELAPEVQIQRLTAQLTAAYNRIAALEEQLFARRVH